MSSSARRRSFSIADYDRAIWLNSLERFGVFAFGGPGDPGGPVVLLGRVSHPNQMKRGNARNQVAALERAAVAAGRTVHGRVAVSGKGWTRGWFAELRRSAAFARKNGASLLMDNLYRFVRPVGYGYRSDKNATPDETDLERLRDAVGPGVVLLTLVRPDAPPAAVKSAERRRGQTEKNNKGGRPKKWEPEPLLKKIRRLRATKPKPTPYRVIAGSLGVPLATVYRLLASANGTGPAVPGPSPPAAAAPVRRRVP